MHFYMKQCTSEIDRCKPVWILACTCRHAYLNYILRYIDTYIQTYMQTYTPKLHTYIHTFIHSYSDKYIHTSYIHTYIHTHTIHTHIQPIITNVDHRIRNQQISLNSLGMTPSQGVDENQSRSAFCACV